MNDCSRDVDFMRFSLHTFLACLKTEFFLALLPYLFSQQGCKLHVEAIALLINFMKFTEILVVFDNFPAVIVVAQLIFLKSKGEGHRTWVV